MYYTLLTIFFRDTSGSRKALEMKVIEKSFVTICMRNTVIVSFFLYQCI